MVKKIFKTFFRDKPIALLLYLKNSEKEVYASSVAKAIDCTYSHVLKLLQLLEQEKLIVFNRHGRLKLLNLTKKGEEFVNKIEQARSVLS